MRSSTDIKGIFIRVLSHFQVYAMPAVAGKRRKKGRERGKIIRSRHAAASVAPYAPDSAIRYQCAHKLEH